MKMTAYNPGEIWEDQFFVTPDSSVVSVRYRILQRRSDGLYEVREDKEGAPIQTDSLNPVDDRSRIRLDRRIQ